MNIFSRFILKSTTALASIGASVLPLPSCLRTIRIWLTLLPAVEVGQQVACAALQVRAGEVAVKVGHELVKTFVVGRAPEVLGVLVQPRAQDGRNSAETQRTSHPASCKLDNK